MKWNVRTVLLLTSSSVQPFTFATISQFINDWRRVIWQFIFRRPDSEEALRIRDSQIIELLPPSTADYLDFGIANVHKIADEIEDSTSVFSAGSRYVGDLKCWTIPILPIQLPEGYIETNSWTYSTMTRPTTLEFLYLCSDTIYSPSKAKNLTVRSDFTHFCPSRKSDMVMSLKYNVEEYNKFPRPWFYRSSKY